MNGKRNGNSPPSLNPEDWPDSLPPCLISVDTEGRFWHLGSEMIHEGINRLLTEHVILDEKGRYVIEFKGQRCFVEVEDTLFVVKRVTEKGTNGSRHLMLLLNDGTEEELSPASLTQNEENILYTRVKNGEFPARFLRSSYYQLAEFIEEKNGEYVLPLGGCDWPIKVG